MRLLLSPARGTAFVFNLVTCRNDVPVLGTSRSFATRRWRLMDSRGSTVAHFLAQLSLPLGRSLHACIMMHSFSGNAAEMQISVDEPPGCNQATTRHIDFFRSMIAMLKYHGVTPIVVLDGAPLPVS